ncbi:LytR/AlgR family response regulator transcription factor [Kordia sp.]|uniref:LytR/AlgR family response regulator transcription factor n=1 Tax=Kordia sp. TaxID=1965332 RepID=UPI003D6A8764
MEPINCIIIDDEFLARKLLIDYIGKLPQVHLLESFDNALNALDYVHRNSVDLIFCDIQMPDLTGIDFIKSLQKKPVIIFTTAYSEFALQGYELDVVEYLLKPFSLPRFIKAINKATEIIRLKRLAHKEDKKEKVSTETTLTKENIGFMLIKSDRKIHKVFYDEILFIEGALEYVNFYTKTKRVLGLYSLKELEDLLPTSNFMRVHKSYIVALKKVNEIDGNQAIIQKHKIPIGKRHKNEFLKRFGL